MMIVGDKDQDRLALTILAEVRAEEKKDIGRYDAIENVAAARNFGVWGIEQYVELGEAVEALEEDWKAQGF